MKHASFIQRISAMGLALLVTSLAAADELIPATSEDLAQFDQQLARQAPSAPHSHSSAIQNFGKRVSGEAHKLNSQDPSQMKKFGKWVKSQRQQEDQRRGSLSGMERDGASSARTVTPTNGSAFPGNSNRRRDSERRDNKKH